MTRSLAEFDIWLEKLGDGKLQPVDEEESLITLPQELCEKIDESQVEKYRNDAIDFTFGNISRKSELLNLKSRIFSQRQNYSSRPISRSLLMPPRSAIKI